MFKVVYFDIAEKPLVRFLKFDSKNFESLDEAKALRDEYLSYVPFAFVIEIDEYSDGTYQIFE